MRINLFQVEENSGLERLGTGTGGTFHQELDCCAYEIKTKATMSTGLYDPSPQSELFSCYFLGSTAAYRRQYEYWHSTRNPRWGNGLSASYKYSRRQSGFPRRLRAWKNTQLKTESMPRIERQVPKPASDRNWSKVQKQIRRSEAKFQ